MLARTRYCNAVEKLEEVEIQAVEKVGGCAFFERLFAPRVECALGSAEDFVYAALCVELAVDIG